MSHTFRYAGTSMYGMVEIHRCTCGEEVRIVVMQPEAGLELMQQHIEESR